MGNALDERAQDPRPTPPAGVRSPRSQPGPRPSPYPQSPPKDPAKERIDPADPGPGS